MLCSPREGLSSATLSGGHGSVQTQFAWAGPAARWACVDLSRIYFWNNAGTEWFGSQAIQAAVRLAAWISLITPLCGSIDGMASRNVMTIMRSNIHFS
eukprot:SAG31_NODE_29584_length_392_cov_13.488055_1_plen_97_part_10